MKAERGLATLVAASAVAVVYFLAARLGFALRSAPLDVAVFWPASGIAAGFLIIANRRVSPAIVVGVIVGTVAANLMSDRQSWTSLLKGLCNAGEAVLVAGLIERWFGLPFAFDDLRRLLGFLAATCLGAAASALGGAATITVFHTAAPYWDVWRAWFLSDGVGIMVVAPLIIGLGQAWRNLPTRGEWVEGVGALALMSLASLYVVTHPTGSWVTFSPGALVLPLLLWLTARCQPTFGIAGAFVASFMVIWAITFGIGRFGDSSVPVMERVKGAQLAMTMVTVYTLVLLALFAQRQTAEKALANERAMLRVLVAELDHRVKNVLANVSAVVSHTRRDSTSVSDFAAALDGRIGSMARTHELLSAGRWQGISLMELVRRELAPYATRNNTEINGAEVVLRGEAGQAMAMVIHELATNAAKYGALSTSNGRVSIRWDRRSNGHARSQLVLEWREIDGPRVVAPGKPSYGTSTICDLIPYEFGGTVDFVLAPDGVRFHLELPTDWLCDQKPMHTDPRVVPALEIENP
jgi:two-component sensor histidine kinase/integral membrane sensor domain MASE1